MDLDAPEEESEVEVFEVPGGTPKEAFFVVKKEDIKAREWPIPRKILQEFVAVERGYHKDPLLKEILESIDGTSLVSDDDESDEECKCELVVGLLPLNTGMTSPIFQSSTTELQRR